jgi:hypothetical protein
MSPKKNEQLTPGHTKKKKRLTPPLSLRKQAEEARGAPQGHHFPAKRFLSRWNPTLIRNNIFKVLSARKWLLMFFLSF